MAEAQVPEGENVPPNETASKDDAAGAPSPAPVPAPSNQMGAYSQRELLFVEREARGELAFRYIRNDGDPQNLEWCARLKAAGGLCTVPEPRLRTGLCACNIAARPLN